MRRHGGGARQRDSPLPRLRQFFVEELPIRIAYVSMCPQRAGPMAIRSRTRQKRTLTVQTGGPVQQIDRFRVPFRLLMRRLNREEKLHRACLLVLDLVAGGWP